MNERDRAVFFLLRLSFRATNDFPSFPFSGTHHVIGTNNYFVRETWPANYFWFANPAGYMYDTSP